MSKAKTDTRDHNNGEQVDTLQRIGVGLLYAAIDLGQSSIAQIMGMSNRSSERYSQRD